MQNTVIFIRDDGTVDKNPPKEKEFKEALKEVVSSHPFDTGFFWSKYRNILNIVVRVYEARRLKFNVPTIVAYDFPKITLYLGVWNYIGEGNNITLEFSEIINRPFNEDSVKKILYHEFGHAVDEKNLDFKYSLELKDEAKKYNLKFSLDTVWNSYIDRRLSKDNFTPYTFEERVDEAIKNSEVPLNEAKKSQVKELLEKIWDSEFLTYLELICEAQSSFSRSL